MSDGAARDMQRIRSRAWLWGATPGLCLVVIVLHFAGGAADALEFRPASLADGAWWRLITGHFVHWNLSHLGWDVIAFGVLASCCERLGRRSTWTAIAMAALAIPLVVAAIQPEITSYRGLSGLASGLLVLLAAQLCMDPSRDPALRWRPRARCWHSG